MTAEQALEEFIELSVNVLQPERMDPQARTTRLEEYIEDLLRRHRVEREMRLLDANPRSGGCKLLVLSVCTMESNESAVLFPSLTDTI